MHLYGILLLAFILASGAAMAAEDSAIRIIREDGSVTEYTLSEGVAKVPAAGQSDPAVQPVAQAAKEEEKPEEKVESVSVFPLPGRKPLLIEKIAAATDSLDSGRAIPENLAVAVAIEHAPPARDFAVLRRMYNNIPVYAVMFKTENGPYAILVDARSGKVVVE